RRQGRHPRSLRHVPDGQDRGSAADVCGNLVAHRPTGAARSGMTTAVSDETDDEGRGVPGMKVKPRVPDPRGEQPERLAANEAGCARISLRCASMRRNIALNSRGIRGMSVQTSRILSQRAVHDCLFLILIAFLSLSNYITGLGFYSDDW